METTTTELKKLAEQIAEAIGYSAEQEAIEEWIDQVLGLQYVIGAARTLDELAREYEETYQGQYDSGAEFAEAICTDCGDIPENVPAYIVIDWQATYERNLCHDYTITTGGYVFRYAF
jgi:hypothetical protein